MPQRFQKLMFPSKGKVDFKFILRIQVSNVYIVPNVNIQIIQSSPPHPLASRLHQHSNVPFLAPQETDIVIHLACISLFHSYKCIDR